MSTAEPAARVGGAAAGSPIRLRELEIVREIAEAFLTATQALEVYRRALQRLTPLVNASFASIFLRDAADPSLLKLECAHNWPQSSARYLADLRIRVGLGPTGRAVSGCEAVEVEDVFADPLLREWWEPAKELGCAALISLPLVANGAAVGAISFYYTTPHRFNDDERHTLRLLAAQLAAMSSRAQRFEELHAANLELKRDAQALTARIGEAAQLERMKDEFLAGVGHELRTPLTAILGYTALLADGTIGTLQEEQATVLRRIEQSAGALLRLINDLIELSQLRLGRVSTISAETDAVLLARHAVERTGAVADTRRCEIVAASARVPVTSDAEKIVRILCALLEYAGEAAAGGITIRVHTCADAAAVEWQVCHGGAAHDSPGEAAVFDEFRQIGASGAHAGRADLRLALCRRNAELLGGTLDSARDGANTVFTLRLPRRP